MALSGSAALLGASFLFVSVASDVRYHLWTMIGSALAYPLLGAAGAIGGRHIRVAALLALAVVSIGMAGRMPIPFSG